MHPIKTHRRTRSSNELELELLGRSPRAPAVRTLYTYSSAQDGAQLPRVLRASDSRLRNKMVVVEALDAEVGLRQQLGYLEFGSHPPTHSNFCPHARSQALQRAPQGRTLRDPRVQAPGLRRQEPQAAPADAGAPGQKGQPGLAGDAPAGAHAQEAEKAAGVGAEVSD